MKKISVSTVLEELKNHKSADSLPVFEVGLVCGRRMYGRVTSLPRMEECFK